MGCLFGFGFDLILVVCDLLLLLWGVVFVMGFGGLSLVGFYCLFGFCFVVGCFGCLLLAVWDLVVACLWPSGCAWVLFLLCRFWFCISYCCGGRLCFYATGLLCLLIVCGYVTFVWFGLFVVFCLRSLCWFFVTFGAC